MIPIRIEIDTKEQERRLSALGRQQFPFAASLALNNLTKLAQGEVRAHYRKTFTLRRPDFIEKQGAKIFKFSSKRDLSTVFGVDPKADFLEKFEQGGTKRPTAGRLALAVPLDVKRNKRDIITRGNRPRAFGFIRGTANVRTKITRYFGRKRTFLIQYPDGRGWIFKRKAKGRSGELFAGTSVLYTLQPSGQIAPQLEFVGIAARVAARDWVKVWDDAFAKAMRTAR